MWATTQEAIDDLRNLLGDSDVDKYAYRKKVIGTPNGSIVSFKTLERRRVTDFTTSVAPFGVYVNDALVSVSADSTQTGEITLAAAPVDGDDVTASYYYQWFIDSELDQFLKNASQWLGLTSTYINVPDGLVPSALHYAGQEAYHRLANWWQTRLSETYRLEDVPSNKDDSSIKNWLELAKTFEEKALRLRNDYYTRQGQNLQPLFGSIRGSVRDLVPKR